MKLVSETEVGHARTYMGLVSIQYASLSLCYLLKENSRLAMGQAGIQSTEEFRVSPFANIRRAIIMIPSFRKGPPQGACLAIAPNHLACVCTPAWAVPASLFLES